MKSFHLLFLALCVTVVATTSYTKASQQESFLSDIMANQDKVPGHNNAIYGPVPRDDQILDIEFLEIAPTPIMTYVLSYSLTF